jgi:transcriptional regulator with XRE-family HTH domain
MMQQTLGGAIATARKEKGWSQKELAAKLLREDGEAISPQYLNDIERDRRNPGSDHMISQFASVLGINADYLHYLNGRFPQLERSQKLSEEKFNEAMAAFRRKTKS